MNRRTFFAATVGLFLAPKVPVSSLTWAAYSLPADISRATYVFWRNQHTAGHGPDFVEADLNAALGDAFQRCTRG